MNIMSFSSLYYTKTKSDIFYEGIMVNLYHQKKLSPFFYHSTVGHFITCWKNASDLEMFHTINMATILLEHKSFTLTEKFISFIQEYDIFFLF
jgi:hypothetical protein